MDFKFAKKKIVFVLQTVKRAFIKPSHPVSPVNTLFEEGLFLVTNELTLILVHYHYYYYTLLLTELYISFEFLSFY